MYESQVDGCKENMATMTNEMSKIKKKFYLQKRKLQEVKEITLKSTCETILPDILVSNKKFYGGGFKITTPTPKSCCIVTSSASR